MKISQISIFLENKAGRLAEVTSTLAKASINIMALSLADTSDFGILRLIVDDHEKAKTVLKDNGFTVGVNTVLVAEVPHVPGGLDKILQYFSSAGVNVEYMYAYVQRSDNAIMVFRCSNEDAAIKALTENGVKLISEVALGTI